jgi:hypothetical protein
MVRAGVLVLALTSCGRVGFESVGAGDATGSGTRAPCAFDLCEDFEPAALDSSLWTIGPMVTRDSAVAHRGTASARMHVDTLAPNGVADATLTESRTLVSSRDMWVRGWFRLSALPAGANELELIGLAQSTAGAAVNSVYVRADQVGFDLLGGISASTMLALPPGTWFCLVWHVRLATSGGAMHLDGDLFDGPDVSGGQTDVAPPISVLRFGIRFASTQVPVEQPATDLWFDDLIVHSAPVSCAD